MDYEVNYYTQIILPIESTKSKIIEYDNENHCPSERDGIQVPLCSDLVDEELSFFVLMI